MFELQKSFSFEAGHSLKYHEGKCRGPHGHSYHMEIVLRSAKLVESGTSQNMVMDFGDISGVVKPMIEEYLDHQWLNDTLGTDSPTAEYIARWVYEYLESRVENLYAVELRETNSAKVTYYGKV